MNKDIISRALSVSALLFGLASAAAASNDALGVAELYPTAPAGKEWVSNWANGSARTFGYGDDPQDSWFHGKGNATYSVDGKGLFKVSGAVPRMYIYDPALVQSWRSVEMTVYAMRVSDSGTSYGGIEGVARTNHTADTTNLCDTRGNDARFRYDGHIDFEKETSHPNSVPVQNKPYFPGGLPYNQWIGYKLVVYDLANGDVKLENYMDLTDGANGGTWVKVNEIEDTGKNFGVGGTPCKAGIDPALRLTNSDARPGSETGKPNQVVYWRSDNVGTNGLIYKKMSVREINPTGTTADTTPPVVSGVAASGIGQNSATIAWATDEDADGQVEYGLTASYGSATALNAGLAKSHSAVLSGLSVGTLYHYRVKSRDAAGNLATSLDGTFTTVPAPSGAVCLNSAGAWQNAPLTPQNGTFTAEFDATPGAPKIDGVSGLSNGAASAYTSLAASIRFNNTGTIDARNAAGYGAAASIPYSAGLTYHFRLVVDLAAHAYSAYVKQGGNPEQVIGSNYAFRSEQKGVSTLNNLGLLASSGSQADCAAAITPSGTSADTTAPVISGLAASGIGQASATLSWATNEPADTQAEYGLTPSYGSTTALSPALSAAHASSLSGLSAGTLYHYRVKSRDAAGNLAASPDGTFTTAAASPAQASSLSEDFSAYAINACLAEGSTFGPWKSVFSGYGCTSVKTDGVKFWLDESPFASASASETHSSLVLGPSFAAPMTLSARINTNAQLRKNTPPNPWEAAWVIWNYADNTHFYYFEPKPNGWELGKEDPAYPGAQRFLATGSSPIFPIGAWYAVKIVQAQNVISIYVNGQLLTTFTDTERPYTSGSIGFYNEDSNARFEDVAVNMSQGISSVVPASAADDQAKAPQKFLSPRLADGVNDIATFGLSAQEVSIYSIRGQLVFHGSQQSGTPIIWNCRDGSGRIRESGIYIAKIRKSDSQVLYQSFALVK